MSGLGGLDSRARAADCREGDGMPYGADLLRDQVVELVATVRRGGQPEPAARRDLLDDILERRGRNVVAFIGDDQPISRSERSDVVTAGEGLQGKDVDRPPDPRPPTAKLAGLHAQQAGDLGAPLIGQRLTVHEDESRCPVYLDQGTRDHGFACARWGDEHADVVGR